VKLLDLFCGAGGAAVGYHRAGFEVVGVDIVDHSKYYPYEFIQGDALTYLMDNYWQFDAIHASPPCQRFSQMQHIHKNKHKHPDLLTPTRKALQTINKPYVIENVVGAPLRIDLMLCGTMFGLRIIKHRIFESNISMPLLTMMCNHEDVYDPWHGHSRGNYREKDKLFAAMGIDWYMPQKMIGQALPPAYTEYIGKILMEHLSTQEKSPAATGDK